MRTAVPAILYSLFFVCSAATLAAQQRQVVDPSSIESMGVGPGGAVDASPAQPKADAVGRERVIRLEPASTNQPVRLPVSIPVGSAPASSPRQETGGSRGILPDVAIQYPESMTLNVPAVIRLQMHCSQTGNSSPARLIVTLPDHVELVRSQPAAQSVRGHELEFAVPELDSARPLELQLEVIAREKRGITVQTRMELVREQKLEMLVTQPVLDVQLRTGTRALLGEQVLLELEVRNSGDGPARDLRIDLQCSAGCVVEEASLNQLRSAGTLGPGETAVFPVVARAMADGLLSVAAAAHAEGADSPVRELAMQVIRPALEIAVVAPQQTWVGSRAWFGFTVTNPTSIVIPNAVVVLKVPSLNIQTISSEAEYQPDQQTLTWRVGDLDAGQSAEFQMLAVPSATGPHLIVASVESSLTERKEVAVDTLTLARAQLQVALSQLELPAPAGMPARYRVAVTNEGTEDGNAVEVTVQLPRDWTASATAEAGFAQGQVRLQIPVLRAGETRELVFEATGPRAGEFPLRVSARHQGSQTPSVTETTVALYQTDLRRVAEQSDARTIR